MPLQNEKTDLCRSHGTKKMGVNVAALPRYRFIEQLKALPCMEAIYLYGSRARNTHRLRSDIDLAIVCPSAGSLDWHRILAIIKDADTLLAIDCLRLDQEPPASPLRQAVEHDGRVIYERD
ncbi:MAG: nucleotidyltransferase domain-containing protein [Magnetococcus sp. YQC-5]